MKRKDDSIINLIAAAAKTWPGSTAQELASRIERPGAHKRLSEIRDLGLVKSEGTVLCSVTGRVSKAWYPDDAPPQLDRGKERPQDIIKRLRGRIAYLESENTRLSDLVNEKTK